MKETEKLITDKQLDKAWGYANFGDIPKRQIINKTLLQIAEGYSVGHTAQCIVVELGLINLKKWSLTKLGLEYILAANYECRIVAIPLHKEETPAHQEETGVKEEAENIVEKWKQDAIKHLGFSNFIKGNYTNECLLCKELFHNGDKKQLVCEKCCESINNNFHLESIKCPVCGKIQEAKVEHTIPFPTFIHDCIECEYTIMESEWDKVSTPAHQTGAKEKAREQESEFDILYNITEWSSDTGCTNDYLLSDMKKRKYEWMCYGGENRDKYSENEEDWHCVINSKKIIPLNNSVKTKAKELVDKFMPLMYRGESKYNLPQAKEAKKNAKQFALIHCDEIIAIFDNLISHYSDDFIPAKEHWQQVRKEISNL